MENKAPRGRDSGSSPFQKLSAGSIGSGSERARRKIVETDGLVNNALDEDAAARASSILGLESAVSSAAESARAIERARIAFEEVTHANRVAAMARVADVSAAADSVRLRSANALEGASKEVDSQRHGYPSTKGSHGSLR